MYYLADILRMLVSKYMIKKKAFLKLHTICLDDPLSSNMLQGINYYVDFGLVGFHLTWFLVYLTAVECNGSSFIGISHLYVFLKTC